MRANHGQTFFIQWVRATGKQKGTVKTVAKALYGAPKRALKEQRESVNPYRAPSSHVENGTIPLTDYDKGLYLSPLIATIISFNGFKVIH